MKKVIVNLTSHDGNEYRKVTEKELNKLEKLEEKYGYLDAVSKKEYKFVEKILKKKLINIYEITRYE